MFSKKLLPLIFAMALFCGQSDDLFGQPLRTARYFPASVYHSDSFPSSPQNWDFIQNEKGLLYVSNNGIILEYDGRAWQKVENSLGLEKARFARTASGRVYVGGREELGYIGADAEGRSRFYSLLDSLPVEIRDSLSIHQVFAAGDRVFFISDKSRTLLSITAESGSLQWQSFSQGILTGCEANGKGVFLLADGSLVYADQTPIQKIRLPDGLDAKHSMLFSMEGGRERFLFMTWYHGAWLIGEGKQKPWAEGFYKRYPGIEIRKALRLNDGNIALASWDHGVFILDPEGKVAGLVNKEMGLGDNSTIGLYQDANDDIWVGLHAGLSLIHYPLALTGYGPEQQLEGVVLSSLRRENLLYAGTTKGLYRAQVEDFPGPMQFVRLPLTKLEVWDMQIIDGELYVAGSEGLFVLRQGRFRKLVSNLVFSILPSKIYPGRLYAGRFDGISVLKPGGNSFAETRHRLGIQARDLLELPDGNLLAAFDRLTLLRLNSPDTIMTESIPFEGEEAADVNAVEVSAYEGEILVGSNRGFFQYVGGKAIPHALLNRTLGRKASLGIYALSVDHEDNIWCSVGNQAGRFVRLGDGYQWDQQGLELLQTDFWKIQTVENGATWFCTTGGLFRFLRENAAPVHAPPAPVFRRIITTGDSLLFVGNPDDRRFVLDFSHNDLNLLFNAPEFLHPDRLSYSIRLDGFDEQWTPWKPGLYQKEYTGLWEGKYLFSVKARNPEGQESEVSTFAFQILPPWYRSWWAYLGYLVILGFVSLQLVRLQTRKSEKKIAQKEAELQRERATAERLRQVDKLKDQFLANTSHELRTPLNGIIGLSESLRRGVAGEPTAEMKKNLDLIISSGKRLAGLVNDLLDLSRIKNHDLQIHPRPVDLRTIVQVVLDINRPLCEDKNLDLRNAIPDDLPRASGDENRLQQILHNLVGNGIKFTSEGYLEVGATADQGQITVSVKDTGAGIPKNKFDQIFDEVEQVDGSINRSHPGTGLGLAISRRLVELHGGRMWLESELNKGSTFFFTLPVSGSSAPAAPEEVKVEPRPIAAPQTSASAEELVPDSVILTKKEGNGEVAQVLVVDDEPVNLQVIRNILSSGDYRVTTVTNGEDALKLIGEQDFDLVLLDVMMPRISGLEVCRRIRDKFLPSELPVILITAKNQVSDLVEGLSTGANDYIPKPFSQDELLARIRTQLNLHSFHKVTGRFVPIPFIRALGKESISDVRLGDHVEKELTVLFSDIRNYTGLAEAMSPEENFTFVNAMAGRLGPAVHQNRGFINQYLGDGVMAIFEHSPEDALRAGIAMQRAVADYNATRKMKDRDPIKIGIGIHMGPLIMGIIGDELRTDAATISDTVNTASRMEGLTKYFEASIILSKETLSFIPNTDRYQLRPLGLASVKGKSKAMEVYECFDPDPPELVELKRQTLGDFKAGLQAFSDGDFAEALKKFGRVVEGNPSDYCAMQYLERCREGLLG